MNITQLTESDTRQGGAALYTYFDYDALNRLSAHRTKRQVSLPPMSASWVWVKRSHNCDAIGRLVKSNWKTWLDGGNEPGGDTSQHIYAGAKHIQNYDGTNYGAVWHWAGAQHEHMGPLRSPNADTASQTGYNIAAGGADESGGGGAGGMTPQRRTFLSPTSEGDQRHLFGQGRPMAKDSSGSGSNWATGTQSLQTVLGQSAVTSRLFFEGALSSTDMSRVTDAREKQRIGLFGTGSSYAGSYGRVTSESIGRDINPLGRGMGQALVAGALNLGMFLPRLPMRTPCRSTGNSVNNFTIPSSWGLTPPLLLWQQLPPIFRLPPPWEGGQLPPFPPQDPSWLVSMTCEQLYDCCLGNTYGFSVQQQLCCARLTRLMTEGECWELLYSIYPVGDAPLEPPQPADPFVLELDCCMGKSAVPCRQYPNQFTAFACAAAGAGHLAFNNPQGFCAEKRDHKDSSAICRHGGGECAAWCIIDMLIALGLSILLEMGSFLVELIVALIKILFLIYRNFPTLEDLLRYLPHLPDVAIEDIIRLARAILEFIFSPKGKYRLAKALACIGCCAIGTATCVAQVRGMACVTTDGKRESWADCFDAGGSFAG